MTPPRAFLRQYRFVLIALAVSLGVHALLIVGVRGSFVPGPEPEAASYSVELAPLPDATVVVPGAAPAPPAPRPPRPRSPRKPTEAIASLPPLATGAGSATDALPAMLEAPAPLAPPEPEKPVVAAEEPPPKPEMLAAAVPSAPIPALEPREFPVEALPANLSIQYALTSPFADGQASYTWSREGDQYSISGSAEASGFFTLFLEGRILQESRGKVTAQGLQPERFVERKPQGPEEGLTFDWPKGTVEFHRNDEVKRGALAERTVDWLSMIFQLAHTPPHGGGPVALKVYTQRKLYEFELKVLGTEELQLPMGKVKALHLRHATNDPKETVDVWLGIDHHYLPVKLRYPVARNRFMVDQVATSITSR